MVKVENGGQLEPGGRAPKSGHFKDGAETNVLVKDIESVRSKYLENIGSSFTSLVL